MAYRAAMTEPMRVTRLLLWEFRQSVRFQAFRHSRNRDLGFSFHEAEMMIAKLSEHMAQGIAKMTDCDFINILATGERISESRTFANGHRSFDILHVATAVELGAKEFLSFDTNQMRLASAEGLVIPEALS